jgi:uncharacterized protein (TIGR02996 family)
MPENQRLLQMCLDAPKETDRLLVYADWLEQEGDPRSAYARAQLELRRSPATERARHLAGLRKLYPVEHPAWCGRFEQAGVFEANLIDVPELWWGVGLGKRDTSATYQGFAYHQQPPLPVERFGGDFTWLRSAPRRTSHVEEEDQGPWLEKLKALRAKGWFVPPVCERLLPDVQLQLRVPSCTDNTFLSADGAEEHPLDGESCFLTFYTDSQSCVLWGLRLGQGDDRYTPVLAGAPQFPEEDPPEGAPYFSFPELTFCAPTLESFLYRWWLENTLWYATNSRKRALSAEEQAYLDRLSA